MKRDSDNAGDEQRSDRWLSIGLSVVLHGALVALLVYGVWNYRSSQPPKPTLAIEAQVVTGSQAVRGAPIPEPPAPTPPPPPPPEQAVPKPEPPDTQGPPQPTPEELAQRAQAQKEQEEKAAAQAKQEEEARQAQEEAERQAEQQRQDEAKKVAAKAEAQRKAQEQAKAAAAAAEAKKKAEEKRLAEQKRLDEEKRKAQDAQERAQSEADLKRSLAAEEKQNANARALSGAMASWESLVKARIQRAWIQPPTARPGIQCEVLVTQVPGGTVTSAHVGTCNGDAAVRESIESAVFRASPLPPPPDPSLFQSQLLILFTPN